VSDPRSAGEAGDDALEREGRALADTLRTCIERLATREVDAATLRSARERAEALCELLDGPRRRRWYDQDANRAELTPASRGAYVQQSPVRGVQNPIAPPLAVTVPAAGEPRRLHAVATLGLAYEGPPRGVHGGWVAALFDDLLGNAQMFARQTGMTAKLTVRYRAVTPIGVPLHFEAWVDEERERRVVARATCHAEGRLTAEAEGLFVKVDFDRVRDRDHDRRDESR